jgi:hypothetical protein
MTLFSKLFGKTPDAKKLRLQLKEVEREHRQKQRQLQLLDQSKQEWVQKAVAAKQAGKQEVVRDIFRKLRQIEIDYGYVSADLRRLSLSKTALNSIGRKLTTLENSRDSKSLKTFHARLQNSPLQKAIDAAAVDDDTFNDLLHEILGEEESAVAKTKAKEDTGFSDFDRAIGEMAEAEDSGIGSRQSLPQSADLSGVSGSVRRQRIAEARAAAVSGSVRRLGISGASLAAVSGSVRRLRVSGASLAAVSGSVRRYRISEAIETAVSGSLQRLAMSGASLAAVSGSVRRLGVSGASLAAVSGRVRRLRISGAGLAAVSGSVRRRRFRRQAASGGIAAEGISGLAFVSGAAYGKRGPGGLGISGSVSTGGTSRWRQVSGATGAIPDHVRARAIFEDARPMPRIFLDGRCGSSGRVVIIEGYGRAAMQKDVPDDRMPSFHAADAALVRLEDAAMFVKGKSVPVRGAGIRVGGGELSFLVDNEHAGWFIREINGLLAAAVSGAGPAVGELMWNRGDGEYTNVRNSKNVSWHTLVIARGPESLAVLPSGNEHATAPGGNPRFSRIIVRPLALGDKLKVHTMDSSADRS